MSQQKQSFPFHWNKSKIKIKIEYARIDDLAVDTDMLNDICERRGKNGTKPEGSHKDS